MQTRRDFLRGLTCAAGALALGSCRSLDRGAEHERGRPNIVLILADDLGYGDPACYNRESKIPTPQINQLVGQGIRFTDAHTPSAVCTPTRYGLLTGQYCWRSRLKQGVLNGYGEPLIETDRLTIASLLKRYDYNTGCVGKWHLGLGWVTKEAGAEPGAGNIDWSEPVTHGPQSLGFDYSYIIPASLDMDPYCWLENGRLVEAPTGHTPGSQRRWSGGGGFWREGAIAPSFDFYAVLPTVTAKSVEFIKRQSTDKPFFLYVPLTAPHTPWMPTNEFRGKTEVDWYGDFVTEVDWAMGQIVKAVDDAGFRDNTLVIFTSDNGSHWPPDQIAKFNHRANGPWLGQKSDIHEGGHRVPFICRWPGHIKPGTQSNQTVCLTDLLATFAAIAGHSLPADAGQDSYDILPAMVNPGLEEPVREATVHHSGNGMFAIRQGPWKLIQGLGSGGFTAPRRVEPTPGGPQGQLYHLDDDPGEQTNLWLKQPGIVKCLSALLARYRQQGYSRPMT
ncbi:MAG: sulfatase-like hydrolase/transferase [Sedimentisphaerales bacterium]|nr:sulfatase-like hydrolase/transferase [Sedimentisphaerales bacterium]